MQYGYSLCLTYSLYNHHTDSLRKALYRIADYEKGRYYPVDPQSFTDRYMEFSPRFVKYGPEYKPDYYSSTLRSWQSFPSQGDNSSYTTKSSPFTQRRFFEVVFGFEKYASDDSIQQMLKDGIRLPQGISDNFLIVTSQEKDTYIALECRKNMFVESNGLYKIKSNLHDIAHAIQYLKEVEIPHDSVFNTSAYYLIDENGNEAECRYFYNRDQLPSSIGEFYLYEIEDYVPFFISMYLKKNGRPQLSKNQIQQLSEYVNNAFEDKNELRYFDGSGWQLDQVLEKLTEMKDSISDYFQQVDNISELIGNQLQNDTEVRELYFEKAYQMWLESEEPKKIELEQKISEMESRASILSDDISDLEREKESLSRELTVLQGDRDAYAEKMKTITDSVEENIVRLDTKMSDYLSGFLFLKNIGAVNGEHTTTNSAIVSKCRAQYSIPENGAKEVNSANIILRVAQNNLKAAGIKAEYISAIANLFITPSRLIHSILIDGIFARSFSDALAYSIDGKKASKITIVNNTVGYEEIYSAVENSSGVVVLIENLLDSCNEVFYSTLNKDFPDKLFVFSVDNEESYSLLSKSIWNYGYLINTDLVCEDAISDQRYVPIIVDDSTEWPTYTIDEYDLDNLQEVLIQLGLPKVSRKKIQKNICLEISNIKETDLLTKAMLEKLICLYKSNLSDEELSNITSALSEI